MTTEASNGARFDDPVTDIDRLIEIASYDIENADLRARLDELAEQAADVLHSAAGMVSIVLDTAQFAAGSHGLDGSWIDEAEGTPVEWAFCANVVRTGAPYVVDDATQSPTQQDNPLVVSDGVRSYAGVPLVTPNGHVLGACCVADFVPHDYSPTDLAHLEDLAADVVAVLSGHRVVD